MFAVNFVDHERRHLLSNQQLGRYHLVNLIAYGGMAEVYRAVTFEADGHMRPVAIKRILSHLAQDNSFVEMLIEEASITGLLKHPNIAEMFEFTRVGDEYFLAMEYVDGQNLRKIIDRLRRRDQVLQAEHCAFILLRVLDALHAVHEARMPDGTQLSSVHRDVSPSNVIVSYGAEVKLCDFGIAKTNRSRVQTQSGMIKGKVRYMSPEQTHGRALDRRSDVFSAATVMYELLTGVPPFDGEIESEIIFRVRSADVPRPPKDRPSIPSALMAMLRRAMARRPEDRFSDALEFARELQTFLRASGYRPDGLARLTRSLFRDEIESDLRAFEDLVVEQVAAADVGDNLLAGVMDKDAPYTQFTPMPPNVTNPDPGTNPNQLFRHTPTDPFTAFDGDMETSATAQFDASSDAFDTIRTSIYVATDPDASDADEPDLHRASTRIFSEHTRIEREQQAHDGGFHQASTQLIPNTQQPSTGKRPSDTHEDIPQDGD